MADKRNRSQQYQRLRSAGFSSSEANRLKGASQIKIDQAIRSGVMPEKDQRKITQGSSAPISSRGYKDQKPPAPPKEHHARTVDYKDMTDLEKEYMQEFNFIVSYKVKGDEEPHYITITSSRDLYKYEVINAAKEILKQDQSGNYNGQKIIYNSINVEECIVNRDI